MRMGKIAMGGGVEQASSGGLRWLVLDQIAFPCLASPASGMSAAGVCGNKAAICFSFAYALIMLVVTMSTYWRFGGDDKPLRCLFALSMPLLGWSALMSIPVFAGGNILMGFGFGLLNPIVVLPVALIFLGRFGAFGSCWGWRWRVALLLVAIEQVALIWLMFAI